MCIIIRGECEMKTKPRTINEMLKNMKKKNIPQEIEIYVDFQVW